MYKPNACKCSIEKEIKHVENKKFIQITNAEKQQSEDDSNNSSSYFVYIIKTAANNIKGTKRRYSEFETFRKSLVKLYPILIIPPIPEKHSITDYTSMTPKDDIQIIEKRKRMLERFLNRIMLHPILRQEHLFHKFIDGSYNNKDWLLNTSIPKDPILQLSIENNPIKSTIKSNLAADTDNSVVPIPSNSHKLNNDHHNKEVKQFEINKSTQQVSIQFERTQKKIVKRLSELSNDLSDLGSCYNALSLNEVNPISLSIEKLSQIIDASSKNTKDTVKSLEVEFSEYVQDYTQYISITKQVLRYHYLKQCQLELINDTIQSKKLQLRSLIKTEEELSKLKISMDDEPEPIKRIGNAYANENNNGNSNDNVDDDIDVESIEDDFSAIVKVNSNDQINEDNGYPINASAPILRSSKNQLKKWSSPRKLLSAVTFTLQGMIDADPEQTRKKQINKLTDTIEQLELARTNLNQDLTEMSSYIKQDFDRFQAQKDAELKTILISFAKIHLKYCEQNVATWKDIRNEVSISMDNL